MCAHGESDKRHMKDTSWCTVDIMCMYSMNIIDDRDDSVQSHCL